MSKVTIKIIMIFVILAILSTSAQGVVGTGVPILPADSEYIIPFQLCAHLIVVTPKFDGDSTTRNFVMDTGGMIFVDSALADELKLHLGPQVPGLNPKRPARLARVDRLLLGPVEVDTITIVILDFMKELGNPQFQGMIGSDFLSFFKVKIDYQRQQLTFSNSSNKSSPASAGITLPSKRSMVGAPMVECRANDSTVVKGMIDTGSPHSLVLPLEYIDSLKIPASNLIKSVGEVARWPISLDTMSYLGRLQEFSMGNITARNLPVIFADVPEVLIGKDYLDQFVITIDYPNNEVNLKPIENIKFKSNQFSTGLSPKKDSSGATIVKGFWAGSPAEKSGIQIGDELLTINGSDVRPLSLSEIGKILMDDSIPAVQLKIRRGNVVQDMTLQKETLLPEVK